MPKFDPKLTSIRRSGRRGSRAIINPLLRIEGETLSYSELSARFGVTEQAMRAAVRKARGLKAGLTKETLKQIIMGNGFES